MDQTEPPRDQSELPSATKLTEFVLAALRELGGSGTNEEIEKVVAGRAGLTEAQLSAPHDPWVPGRTEFCYRMAWARTRLRQQGQIERVGTKQWALIRQGGP
jgi:restriction system protein